MTYSDLLVSLLVVFALLLFTTIARLERAHARQEANRAVVVKTLNTSSRAMAAAAATMGASAVQYDSRMRTLTVRDEVLFDFGSATLRPEGVALIHALATKFVPRLLADTAVAHHIEAIVVEGHTDTVGTYLSNLDLSQRRAQSVMQALVQAADSTADASRLRELLVASGRSKVEAEEAARAGTYDPARARRIVVRVRLQNDALLQQLLGTDGDRVSVQQ